MKITTFNPQIITNNAEEAVGLFEALGFERRHAPSGTAASGNDYTDYRLKDANGFYVDVANTTAPLPRDMTAIRMNVDDFCGICHRADLRWNDRPGYPGEI